MNGIIRKIMSISFMFVMIHIILNLWIQSSEKDRDSDLAQLLKKTADYCKRLDRISLHFVCNEEVKERIYYRYHLRSFSRENSYIYDYQLIRKDEKIEERRILLEENGVPKNEENAELHTIRFWHKYVIFGPIGLLGESRQKRNNYEIKREEKYKGDICYVIEVVPKPGKKTDYLYGKAWVRQSDCSIMKIEWNQESMGNIDGVIKKAEKLGVRPKITFTSEYEFEKNGIRFPSKYFVKEDYIRQTRLTASETTVLYKDYKFFIVETEVKIRQKFFF